MLDRQHVLLLGSASPRRRELLTTLNVPLWVRAADVDESVRPGEAAVAFLKRIVAAKRQAVELAWGDEARSRGCPALLVADTVVVSDGEILGKPRDAAAAEAMLRQLNGREHVVLTRFALARLPSGAVEPRSTAAPAELIHGVAATVSTRVLFRSLDDAEVATYVATGEGADKAGGYAIQGIGAMLVERIEGSYTNVVGLPLAQVASALRQLRLAQTLPLAAADGGADR